MKTIQEKQKEALVKIGKELGITNPMQIPRIVKAVVSVGVGSFKDKKKQEIVVDRLAKITGQKPASRGAKKAIASYKTRVGDMVGYVVTLRGKRAELFLEKLLNVALPRTKDFRGLSASCVDEMGNMTIGIREHTIFPETSDEELKDVFGMGVTIVSSAKTEEFGRAYFKYLGFPFQKDKIK
jgi:large subunit ribosomal protein L5